MRRIKEHTEECEGMGDCRVTSVTKECLSFTVGLHAADTTQKVFDTLLHLFVRLWKMVRRFDMYS